MFSMNADFKVVDRMGYSIPHGLGIYLLFIEKKDEIFFNVFSKTVV